MKDPFDEKGDFEDIKVEDPKTPLDSKDAIKSHKNRFKQVFY